MVKFLRCELCGNIAEHIKDSGVKMVCCGQDMTVLEAKTADATTEKHVPFIEVKDDGLYATVGSTLHPMEEKHYIEWIAFVDETTVKRVNLKPGDEPVAKTDKDFKGDVYEYCNLHGLWKNTVK